MRRVTRMWDFSNPIPWYVKKIHDQERKIYRLKKKLKALEYEVTIVVDESVTFKGPVIQVDSERFTEAEYKLIHDEMMKAWHEMYDEA
jgi:hypothetical protein